MNFKREQIEFWFLEFFDKIEKWNNEIIIINNNNNNNLDKYFYWKQ